MLYINIVFNTLLDTEMTGKERREAMWDSMKKSFVKFLAEQLAQLIISALAQRAVGKLAQKGVAAEAAVTGAAITSAYSPAALVANVATLGGAGVAATASFGLAATALEASKTLVATAPIVDIPSKERGGLIGGRRHSQGGTIIEAEQGEFIVNREAVNKIGVENLIPNF